MGFAGHTKLARKQNKIVLVQDLIFHFKARFNREFDDLLHGKADEIAKIAERNAKISKIAAELHVAVTLTPIVYHVSEHPEVRTSVHDARKIKKYLQDLLEVKESEISVPRVLNAAERAAAAAAAATEAARLAAAASDNPQQRGVLDMMAGRLEDSAAEDVWIDPALPPMCVWVGVLWLGEFRFGLAFLSGCMCKLIILWCSLAALVAAKTPPHEWQEDARAAHTAHQKVLAQLEVSCHLNFF
jgi:hypothetical protein